MVRLAVYQQTPVTITKGMINHAMFHRVWWPGDRGRAYWSVETGWIVRAKGFTAPMPYELVQESVSLMEIDRLIRSTS
jgi:hypothetical protein